MKVPSRVERAVKQSFKVPVSDSLPVFDDEISRILSGVGASDTITYAKLRQAWPKAEQKTSLDSLLECLSPPVRNSFFRGKATGSQLVEDYQKNRTLFKNRRSPVGREVIEAYYNANGMAKELVEATKAMTDAERSAFSSGELAPKDIGTLVQRSNLHDCDVIVVGAGAAGLAAASTLRGRGKRVVVLEASDRVGGRANAIEYDGTTVDEGAAWLHSSDENPLTTLTQQLGFTTLADDGDDHVLRNGLEVPSGARQIQQRVARMRSAAKNAALADKDIPLQEVIKIEDAFDQRAANELAELDMGASPEDLSTFDVAKVAVENHGRDLSNSDLLIKEGLGSVVGALAHNIPVRLQSPVKRVTWGPDGVIVATKNEVYRASKLLLTVSAGVLASGAIEFEPELPQWKLDAIAALPMAHFDKIVLFFRDGALKTSEDGQWYADLSDSNPLDIFVKPCGAPVVIGMVGGKFDMALQKQESQAAIEYVMKKLRSIYGDKIEQELVGSFVTDWTGNPNTCGAWAVPKPGFYQARAALKKPIQNVLYFAGEACSEKWAGMVPGAYLTGRSAADEISRELEGEQSQS